LTTPLSQLFYIEVTNRDVIKHAFMKNQIGFPCSSAPQQISKVLLNKILQSRKLEELKLARSFHRLGCIQHTAASWRPL